MTVLLQFLQDNAEPLSFLLAVVVAIVGGGWAIFTFRRSSNGGSNVSAPNGVAVNKNSGTINYGDGSSPSSQRDD